ncbi:unnamed protein product [Meganyctiphanes norvegica]|uniref:BZIP domain-containing protein n=1 Tax=Meganyctiphanes norvegica TaxID=48144 RepID=A0AAV2R6U2_MEGNR
MNFHSHLQYDENTVDSRDESLGVRYQTSLDPNSQDYTISPGISSSYPTSPDPNSQDYSLSPGFSSSYPTSLDPNSQDYSLSPGISGSYPTSPDPTSQDYSLSPGIDHSHRLCGYNYSTSMDPISQDYYTGPGTSYSYLTSMDSKSQECSTSHFRGDSYPTSLDHTPQNYNRDTVCSDSVIGAEGGWSFPEENYNISAYSEDTTGSFGLDLTPDPSDIPLDSIDECYHLQDMSLSPVIGAQIVDRRHCVVDPSDFYRNIRTHEPSINIERSQVRCGSSSQIVESDLEGNSVSNENETDSDDDIRGLSDAEKFRKHKEQNKNRAKKYRLKKQQTLKEIEETVIPQLEEKKEVLTSEYDSLKQKIDSLRKRLPQ